MSTDTSPIALTAQFLAAHRQLRDLLGANFPAIIAQPVINLSMIMRGEKCSEVEAFLHVQKFIAEDERPHAVLLYMAAVAEISVHGPSYEKVKS